MTRDEYTDLINFLGENWPMFYQWYCSYEHFEALWFEKLESVSYAAAFAEAQTWALHGAPFKGAIDWQEIPQLLRKPHDEQRRRMEKTESDRLRHIEDGNRTHGRILDKDSNLAAVLRRVQRTTDKGLQEKIIDNYLKGRPGDDPHKQHRYRCKLCLDRGVVICYLPPRGTETATFACHCAEGARYIEKKYLRYDPSNNLRNQSNNFERDYSAWFPLTKSERWEYETGEKRIAANDFGDYNEGTYAPVDPALGF